ncbi:RNA polymerase sigma factor rpoD, putative [Ricinus communis]|uniref:RNA polymerase sigma factor rpoD, putative n=1 Tax=Ricinus communis TaxID=3988 RepID=B9RVK0_RICCO|nr:RNA polymerase sigma factor rpoD, putative [Ricinus communis]
MAITTTITIPSLNFQHPSSSSSYYSSCKFSASLAVSNEALSMAAATEAVALASAAVEAAKEAVTLVSLSGESGNSLVARRKKRRKRRKGFIECLKVEEERDDQCEGALFQPVNNGYLSSIEEAEFCLCLKDHARVEAARRRIAETQEHEPTSKQLAEALRMRKKNVDKILCKGRQSRERITGNYRRLVLSIANRYRGKGLSLQDLIQEGSIGLLRGAERFDPKRGNKLSTYVYWWIKEAIITSISINSRIVRQPRSLWDRTTKIAEAKISLTERLGRLPSYREIAKELNVHVSTVRLVFSRSRSTVSLDQAVSDQGGMTLQEIIPGPEEMMPENMVKKQLLKKELEELIQTLGKREAHTLRLIFGLNGQTPQSCDEIGRSLKLCRERKV